MSMEQWEWKRDIFCYKVIIFLCSQSKLKQRILVDSRSSMVVGNLRFLKIYQIIYKKIGGRNKEIYSNICKRMLGFPKEQRRDSQFSMVTSTFTHA